MPQSEEPVNYFPEQLAASPAQGQDIVLDSWFWNHHAFDLQQAFE